MTARRRPTDAATDADAPLRLRPAVLVPLSADQERQAVDTLAGMLAGLLGHQGDSRRPSCDGSLDGLDVPDDDEAA